MANTISDLRTKMFEVIDKLNDPNEKFDIERAKTIAELGSVIVQSAKVEVDFYKVTGAVSDKNNFITPPKQGVLPQGFERD